jgi:hypothetical protein
MKLRIYLALTLFLVFGSALAAQADFYLVNLSSSGSYIITNDYCGTPPMFFQESYNATHLTPPSFGRSMVVDAHGGFFDVAVEPPPTMAWTDDSISLEIYNGGPYNWTEFDIQILPYYDIYYHIKSASSTVFNNVEVKPTSVHFSYPSYQPTDTKCTFNLTFDHDIIAGLILRQIAITGPLPPAPVPLPNALLLLGSGFMGLGGWRRFRKG